MMRQSCKQMLTIAAFLAGTFVAHAGGVVDAVVTDPLTGVAIEGYDPVTYFTEDAPEPGLPDYEYEWSGVPWYFASAANRDVFMRNPTIYAPQFGGHCATSLSRGFLSDGKPRLYVVEGLKLYLFYSSGNRDAFLAAPRGALEKAEANWPKLNVELTGPVMQAAAPEAAAAASSAEVGAADASQAPIPGLTTQNTLAEDSAAAHASSIAPEEAASHGQPH